MFYSFLFRETVALIFTGVNVLGMTKDVKLGVWIDFFKCGVRRIYLVVIFRPLLLGKYRELFEVFEELAVSFAGAGVRVTEAATFGMALFSKTSAFSSEF